MTVFKMSIELGNDAMQNATQLSEAIEAVGERVGQGDTDGKVMDLNGNSVGWFALTGPYPEDLDG